MDEYIASLVEEGIQQLLHLASPGANKEWNWIRDQYGVKIWKGSSAANMRLVGGVAGASNSPSGRTEMCITKGYGRVAARPGDIFDLLWDISRRGEWDRLVEGVRIIRHVAENVKLLHITLKGQFPVSPRDLCVLMASRTVHESNGTKIIMFRSVTHADVPLIPGHVRAELLPSGWIIEPIRSHVKPNASSPNNSRPWGCGVTYIVRLDPKGWLPSHIHDSMMTYQPLRISALRSCLSKGAKSQELGTSGKKPLASSNSSDSKIVSEAEFLERQVHAVRRLSSYSTDSLLPVQSKHELSLEKEDPLALLMKNSNLTSREKHFSTLSRSQDSEDEDGDIFCDSIDDIETFMGREIKGENELTKIITVEVDQFSKSFLTFQARALGIEDYVNQEMLIRQKAIQGKQSLQKLSNNMLSHYLGRIQTFSSINNQEDRGMAEKEAEITKRLDSVSQQMKSVMAETLRRKKHYRSLTMEPWNIKALRDEMTQAGLIGQQRSGLKSYRYSFIAKEAVDWITIKKNISREKAVQSFRSMIADKILYHVEFRSDFQDSNLLFRFAEDIQRCELEDAQEEEAETKYNNFTKILVFGEGNIGKTTLVSNLLISSKMKDLNPFHGVLPRENPYHEAGYRQHIQQYHSIATDGIERSKVRIDVASEEVNGRLVFSLWDFAGQDVYYATHQFFFSQRSMNVVCVNLTHSLEVGKAQLAFWLNNIRYYSNDPWILIVGTHADKLERKEMAHKIMINYVKAFPFVKDAIAVNSHNKKCALFVFSRIIQLTLKMSHIGSEIPESYWKVRWKMEEYKMKLKACGSPPIISWSEFLSITKEFNINRLQTKPLAHLLNDREVVVYPKDGKYVFLDPEWLVILFASIFSLKNSFVRDGILYHKDLAQLWKIPQLESINKEYLLAILRSLDLVYTVRTTFEEEPYSLIPGLFQDQMPSIPLLFRMAKKELYTYSRIFEFQFIPHSFFARIQVRLLLCAPAVQKYRTSLMLQKGDEIVMIAFDGAKYTIQVTGRVTERAELFLAVVDAIERFISMNGKDVIKEVQVACSHCINDRFLRENPTYFRFSECRKQQLEGNGIMICNKGDTFEPEVAVEVVELAPDLSLNKKKLVKIPYNDVQILENIGEGAFGTVHRALWNGQTVAIKRIFFDIENSTSCQTSIIFGEFRREISILSELEHQCAIQLIGITENPFSIITEFAVYGDLYSYIKKHKGNIPLKFAMKVMFDIAKLLARIHSFDPPLIHNDVKSPNILIFSEDPASEVVAKMCDFGVSSRFPAVFGEAGEGDNPTWQAPEVRLRGEYSAQSDTYELLIGDEPFYDQNIQFLSVLEEKIRDGLRPTLPPNIPAKLKKLVERCWISDATLRPPMPEVVQMLHLIYNEEFNEYLKMDFEMEKGQIFHNSSARPRKEIIGVKESKIFLRTTSEWIGKREKVESDNKQSALISYARTIPESFEVQRSMSDNLHQTCSDSEIVTSFDEESEGETIEEKDRYRKGVLNGQNNNSKGKFSIGSNRNSPSVSPLGAARLKDSNSKRWSLRAEDRRIQRRIGDGRSFSVIDVPNIPNRANLLGSSRSTHTEQLLREEVCALEKEVENLRTQLDKPSAEKHE